MSSQRHKEYIQGLAADGRQIAEGMPAFGYAGPFYADGGNVNPNIANLVLFTKTNPAVITLRASDMPDFKNGDVVKLASMVGAGHETFEGINYTLASKNTTTNTFTLTGVNATALAANLTGGTATRQ